jgi:hypothetical protein
VSYLTFADNGRSTSGKTKLWTIVSGAGAVLGWVGWYAPWRKYCASLANRDVVFDASCFREVADFCEERTKEHKA